MNRHESSGLTAAIRASSSTAPRAAPRSRRLEGEGAVVASAAVEDATVFRFGSRSSTARTLASLRGRPREDAVRLRVDRGADRRGQAGRLVPVHLHLGHDRGRRRAASRRTPTTAKSRR